MLLRLKKWGVFFIQPLQFSCDASNAQKPKMIFGPLQKMRLVWGSC